MKNPCHSDNTSSPCLLAESGAPNLGSSHPASRRAPATSARRRRIGPEPTPRLTPVAFPIKLIGKPSERVGSCIGASPAASSSSLFSSYLPLGVAATASPRATGASGSGGERVVGADDRAPRLLPERHPRAGARRRGEGLLRPGARPEQARDVDVQRRPRGHRGAVRRRHRRRVRRPQPGDQRASRSRTARRSASSPARRRAAPRSSSSPRSTRPPTSRARRSRRRSSATRRTSRCAPG